MAELKFGGFLAGGLILGIWFYGVLFGLGEQHDWGPWMIWGMLGFFVAGSTYAARVVPRTLQWVTITVIGVVLGMLMIGAAVAENFNMFAAFITAVGGSIIAAGVPIKQSSSDTSTEDTDSQT